MFEKIFAFFFEKNAMICTHERRAFCEVTPYWQQPADSAPSAQIMGCTGMRSSFAEKNTFKRRYFGDFAGFNVVERQAAI